MRLTRPCALLALVPAVAACTTPPYPGATGFDSSNPSERLAAISQAARDGDASPKSLRPLLEQLDCEDAAVRLMAITVLERLTGETLGYQPADPVALREAAIRRWQAFVRERTVARRFTDGMPRAGATHG